VEETDRDSQKGKVLGIGGPEKERVQPCATPLLWDDRRGKYPALKGEGAHASRRGRK